MSTLSGMIRRRLFGISDQEVTLEHRGFPCARPELKERLERIGKTFLTGYHAALDYGNPESLVPHLDRIDQAFRGFAYEGAAMGLGLLDRLTPWNRNRLHQFLKGAGDAHAYMVYVALGWVHGRLGGSWDKSLKGLDPLLRWLAVEGYGFHEGYFHWHRYQNGQRAPASLGHYAVRVFDQGLGRSLWFVKGADVNQIPLTISGFAASRQGDLWSGVGLSGTYAGEIPRDELTRLRDAAGPWQSQLAQGACFAAKARERAANLVPYTDLACQVFCGCPAKDAARISDEALENLPMDADQPAFEIWRTRIHDRMKSQSTSAS